MRSVSASCIEYISRVISLILVYENILLGNALFTQLYLNILLTSTSFPHWIWEEVLNMDEMSENARNDADPKPIFLVCAALSVTRCVTETT